MDFNDSDDLFEAQLREQQYKKQKKLDKQARLERKKNLIEEMKVAFTGSEVEYKRGSIEWALNVLNAKQFLSLIEIKKNYLFLAQNLHPDKNNGEECQGMQDLNEAWEIIKTRYR